MKKIVILIILLSFNTQANAAWYRVEMVMFEHLYSDAGEEINSGTRNLPDVTGSVELVDTGSERLPYQIVSRGLHQLGGVYNELKASSEYRPFSHFAWQQPGLGQSRARYVHIRYPRISGDNIDGPAKLDGTVRLRVGYLLHIDIDLAYFFDMQHVPAANSNDNPTLSGSSQVNFTRMTESRRLKLNEIHYFDHPLFGVLVRVSRVQSE